MRRRLLVACTAAAMLLALTGPAAAHPPLSTYEVTITNLTSGQPFTPPFVATHQRSIDFFDVGSPAINAIQEIAENGNLGPALGVASSSSKVFESKAVAGEVPPIVPGASRTFSISAEPGSRNLTWVSMLICSNDGFTGLDSLRLPQHVGDSATHFTNGYDAGTEINTEAWADLVPPCAQITGFGDQGGSGTTTSDLAEGGVISMHPGIAGDANLVPGVHGWTGPVARVEVTRVG